tara:strand:- start:13405 stop:14079 length:675 start_codon:yes stop_codon:yes gene_type:complete
MVEKNLNRWFKEKWVDVSRKNKDGSHPPCGRSKAKTSSKGYPKCRPSVKVSSKTPKTSGSMSEGQKRAATKRKRSKKQGVGGKPTVVKMEYEYIEHEPITAEELAMMTDDDIAKQVTFCSCCSPFEIATTVLKAKKKSKPFHGYNPNKHSKKGGLNAKGRAAAKRKTGANLKPPVTTKPSKLKPGGKKAKRRKSFCARMSGVKGPTSKKGKLTPKGAALKRWNC